MPDHMIRINPHSENWIACVSEIWFIEEVLPKILNLSIKYFREVHINENKEAVCRHSPFLHIVYLLINKKVWNQKFIGISMRSAKFMCKISSKIK